MMTAERVCKYAATGARILLDDDGRVISNPASSHDDDAVDLNAAGRALWRMAERLAVATGRPVLACFDEIKKTAEGRELLGEHAVNESVMAMFSANAGRRVSVTVTDEVRGHRHDGHHPALSNRPDIEIDRRARMHMDKTGEASYSVAVSHVLNFDRELRQAYAKFIGSRK